MLTNCVPGPNNCSSTDGRMPDERWWYWFVYASLGTYFSALLLALANYAVKGENRHLYICRERRRECEIRDISPSVLLFMDHFNNTKVFSGLLLFQYSKVECERF